MTSDGVGDRKGSLVAAALARLAAERERALAHLDPWEPGRCAACGGPTRWDNRTGICRECRRAHRKATSPGVQGKRR